MTVLSLSPLIALLVSEAIQLLIARGRRVEVGPAEGPRFYRIDGGPEMTPEQVIAAGVRARLDDRPRAH
ncbi:hypothetical protein [Methylobacterium nigriterrae]|uniref:hypothetical protein n=1 Tax=Methylobacterium nigriterrae TaxID=3127512 RepID=UPI00301320C0